MCTFSPFINQYNPQGSSPILISIHFSYFSMQLILYAFFSVLSFASYIAELLQAIKRDLPYLPSAKIIRLFLCFPFTMNDLEIFPSEAKISTCALNPTGVSLQRIPIFKFPFFFASRIIPINSKKILQYFSLQNNEQTTLSNIFLHLPLLCMLLYCSKSSRSALLTLFSILSC